MAREAGIEHARDARMPRQPLGHALRARGVSAHAQRQRLDPTIEQERRVQIHASAGELQNQR